MDYLVNAIYSGVTAPVYRTFSLAAAAAREAVSAETAAPVRATDTYVPTVPSTNGDSGLESYLFSEIDTDFARVISAYVNLMLFRVTSETFATDTTVDFLTYTSDLVSTNQAYSILTEARTLTSAIIDLYA